MPPTTTNYARRGGKVHNSQRIPSSPPSQRKKGMGMGKTIPKRRQRIFQRDAVYGITKGDLRRLARRGGVKRLSTNIYEEARTALKMFLSDVLKDCCVFVEHGRRKTVLVTDVIYALRRKGRPIYGFEDVTTNFSRG